MNRYITALLALLIVSPLFSANPINSAQTTDGCRVVMGWDTNDRHDLLKWIKPNDYVWGLELRHNASLEDIQARYAEGWNIVLYQLSHPQSVVRYYTDKRREIPDVKATFEKFSKGCNYDTSRLFWQFFLEDDSNGVCFSQHLMEDKASQSLTHKRSYELMQEYVKQAVTATAYAKGYNKWGMAGYASSAHIFAKSPEVNLITIERANDDVDDLQTGIAFFRGAARQTNKQWGSDVSLWWGGINGCVQTLPALYHKRHLYLSWYSGAEHIRVEGSDLLLGDDGELTELAKCLDEFGAYIKKNKRGEVITKVAVILPEDSGWITSPYWRTQKSVWNYAKVPYRQGQKAIDGFFNMAFPGCNFYMDPFSFGKYHTENPPASPFALSCVSERYAHDTSDVFMAEYPLPFGEFESRDKAREYMQENQVETSHYRPMGVSRWGDIIDVFTENVDADVLSRYEVVVVLDQVTLDRAMQNKFVKAMSSGSTIICSSGVVIPSNSEFCGADIEARLAVGYWWRVERGGVINEPFRYTPATVKSGINVLATAHDSSPILFEKRYGKGRLISCMTPWFEGGESNLSGIAEYIFDKEISPLSPIKVVGAPIEYIITKGDGCINVVLSNSSDVEWAGSIKPKFRYHTATEMFSKSNIKVEKSGAIKIPPFDIVVIQLKLK